MFALGCMVSFITCIGNEVGAKNINKIKYFIRLDFWLFFSLIIVMQLISYFMISLA